MWGREVSPYDYYWRPEGQGTEAYALAKSGNEAESGCKYLYLISKYLSK